MILSNEMIQWACQRLTSLGYQLKNDFPEEVQQTPWSHVVRFETSEGYIYLKHTPKPACAGSPHYSDFA